MAVIEDHAVSPGLFSRFVFGAAGAAVLTHALIAVGVAAAIDPLYADRMYDVRKWPGGPAEHQRVVGTYLRERVSRSARPVSLYAGSSVTHGYPWTQQQTFSYLYGQARGVAVINAAMLALDATGVNDWIICAAKRNNLRVDELFVEIPVVNTVTHLVNYGRAGEPLPVQTCAAGRPDSSYAYWAWTRPRGIGWFTLLWEEEAYVKPDSVIRPHPVPPGYFTRTNDFAGVAQEYDTQIARLLANARTVADRVYAYASPVFAAGLEQIGEDAASVRAQVARALSACRTIEHVECLDSSFLGERQNYFMNFTHLNQAGHRVMAEWLAAQAH